MPIFVRYRSAMTNAVCHPILIELSNLSRVYGPQVVLDEVNWEITPGRCWGITGGNAAGKTTLLRSICGLCRPTTGEVRWWSEPAAASRRRLALPEIRRLLGVVSHTSHAYPHLTLRENLMFAARMHRLDNPRDRVHRMLDNAQLIRFAELPASRVSRGVLQRLTVSCALIHQPCVLVLDEPDTGLDQSALDWLCGVINQLVASDRIVLVATHRTEMLTRVDASVVHIEEGQLRGPERENTKRMVMSA